MRLTFRICCSRSQPESVPSVVLLGPGCLELRRPESEPEAMTQLTPGLIDADSAKLRRVAP